MYQLPRSVRPITSQYRQSWFVRTDDAVSVAADALVALTYTQRTARNYDFGLKVVGALGAIIAASPKTAAFKTCVLSRMGTDHCGRVFRSALHRRAQRDRHA